MSWWYKASQPRELSRQELSLGGDSAFDTTDIAIRCHIPLSKENLPSILDLIRFYDVLQTQCSL